MRPAFVFAALLLAVFSAGGCANYQLGTGAKTDLTSIYIAPVRNDAGVPQATALVTSAVRDAFLRDGRLTLASDVDSADAVLEITLADYTREVTTVRAGDTGLARKFDLDLVARATLIGADGGARFTDRPLPVTRQIFTDSGQLQAEYQALPHLAEQIADRALHAVLDVW